MFWFNIFEKFRKKILVSDLNMNFIISLEDKFIISWSPKKLYIIPFVQKFKFFELKPDVANKDIFHVHPLGGADLFIVEMSNFDLLLCKASTRSMIKLFHFHHSQIKFFCFVNDSSFVSFDKDGSIVIWKDSPKLTLSSVFN